MKNSVPALLIAFTSLISISSWSAETLVSAESLSAGCSMYHNELSILKEERSFDASTGTQKSRSHILYQSSSYFNNSSCQQDRFRAEALINFAKLTGKKVKLGSSNDLSKDLALVNDDGSIVTKITAAKGLEASCRDMNLDGLDMRLVVKYEGTVIYATSRYSLSGDACFADRAKLETKINLARASGKLLNYRFGDSPEQNFTITD